MSEQRNVMIGLGAVALLLVGLAAYSAMQFGDLSAKNAALEKKISDNIAIVDARLSAVEAVANKVQVRVFFFYDSSCAFCMNEQELQNIPTIAAQMAQDGIRLQTIDLKGNYTQALELGVTRAPAFYVRKDDYAGTTRLATYFNTFNQNGYFVANVGTNGVAAIRIGNSLLLGSESCALNSTARLEEFYSPTCLGCVRVKYGNGTVANPDVEIANESASAFLKNRPQIDFKPHCVASHSADENYQALGLDKSDAQLCESSVGKAAADADLQIAQGYVIDSMPKFVVDCKYLFNARTADQLRFGFCAARPDLCK